MERDSDLLERLLGLLGKLERVTVAFSGGTDSTFLLWACAKALGDRVLAVTARSETLPVQDAEACARLATDLGVRHKFLDTHELDDPAYVANPPDRCYHCKHHLFAAVLETARIAGLPTVVEGSNIDDLKEFRPGFRALEELAILSPLLKAGLGKEAIRRLSDQAGLATAQRPASACLASRIPYGVTITREALRRVEMAEALVMELGFRVVRVRDYGKLARIEVGAEELERALSLPVRKNVVANVKRAGYLQVTLDLEGYRMGSLNEELVQ